MKPGLPPLAAMRPNAVRLLPCRPKGPNLPRLRTRRTTKGHEGETADFADWSRLGAGYRRQDAQWKLRSLEAWRLGGATEVEARAAALGGDEAERCAAITVQARSDKPSTAKDTKKIG